MARTVCPMNGLYLCRFGIRKFPKKLIIYLLCRKLIVEKSITYNMYMVAISTEKVNEKTLIYQDLSSFFHCIRQSLLYEYANDCNWNWTNKDVLCECDIWKCRTFAAHSSRKG